MIRCIKMMIGLQYNVYVFQFVFDVILNSGISKHARSGCDEMIGSKMSSIYEKTKTFPLVNRLHSNVSITAFQFVGHSKMRKINKPLFCPWCLGRSYCVTFAVNSFFHPQLF